MALNYCYESKTADLQFCITNFCFNPSIQIPYETFAVCYKHVMTIVLNFKGMPAGVGI
jgi:hypothetical protein